MNRSILKQELDGFSLNELLITLAIIGVLVLIALPNLMPLISKAKSTEAKLHLGHLYTLEKTYFFEYSRYSDNFSEIGFEHERLATEDGKANYQIEVIEAGVGGFKATATAVVDFDGDGVFNLWQIDQDKNLIEIIKD